MRGGTSGVVVAAARDGAAPVPLLVKCGPQAVEPPVLKPQADGFEQVKWILLVRWGAVHQGEDEVLGRVWRIAEVCFYGTSAPSA